MGMEVMAMMAVTGGVMAAGGQLAKGQGEKLSFDAQANAADYNARVDDMRAASERDIAKAEAGDFQRKGDRQLGTMLALQGATGVTSQGSPLMVDSSVVREIALGVARKIHGGEMRAQRFEDDANLQRATAINARKAGVIAEDASYLNAASSLLSSGAQAYGKRV